MGISGSQFGFRKRYDLFWRSQRLVLVEREVDHPVIGTIGCHSPGDIGPGRTAAETPMTVEICFHAPIMAKFVFNRKS